MMIFIHLNSRSLATTGTLHASASELILKKNKKKKKSKNFLHYIRHFAFIQK